MWIKRAILLTTVLAGVPAIAYVARPLLTPAGVEAPVTAPTSGSEPAKAALAPVPTPAPPPTGVAVDPQVTATVPEAVAILTDAGRTIGESVSALRTGLDALASGDAPAARGIRDSLPENALDRHILAWAIALKGGKDVPSGDIASAARVLPGWPGLDALRRNSERAVLAENPAPETVIKLFAGSKPETSEGVIVLARAYLAEGDMDGARAVLSPFWRETKLAPEQEARIIRDFGAVIPQADHRVRMERMLYAGRTASARRVANLAGAKELCDAWASASKGDKATAKLIEAVPEAQRDAGWTFAKARYLRAAAKFKDAAAVMAKAPADAASLIEPDAWWNERRALSRELMDEGDLKGAYKLAAGHASESPGAQADAEFHAGWYALRGLKDAATAARHFERIAALAEGSITRARAYYWLGRAAEAGGPGTARDFYEKAAEYGTTFYGQLAAQKIKRGFINVATPVPSPEDRASFARREAVNAIIRLEGAGYPALADRLYLDLASELSTPGELALLAELAEKRGNHFLALKIGKAALARGIDIGALSHPMGAIPASADISGSGKALAYAIARQESEFNVGAVSSAGAKGLLQLLPTTAKEVARRAGLDYSATRLVTDAGYNATLGAAFLGEQLARFKGSYVLTFAGYNAGPRRAQQWIARYGDPRGKDVDTVVDWIERIPYTETRSYVQRVMENYQVYKMRLTGTSDIAADLTGGRS